MSAEQGLANAMNALQMRFFETSQQEKTVLDAFTAIYNGSPTARSIIDPWVESGNAIKIQWSDSGSRSLFGAGLVDFDFDNLPMDQPTFQNLEKLLPTL